MTRPQDSLIADDRMLPEVTGKNTKTNNKMKTLLFLIILCSCSTRVVDKVIPIKPFVIIDKYYPFFNTKDCGFTYVDANGNQFDFTDRTDLYHIGDTIK